MVVGNPSVGESQGYRAPALCKALGLTYRQVDYWTRTGLVTPSIEAVSGSGRYRLYSRDDAFRLYVIRCLVDAGVTIQRVRYTLDHLDDAYGGDWGRVTFIVCNGYAHIFENPDEMAMLLRSTKVDAVWPGYFLREHFDAQFSVAA